MLLLDNGLIFTAQVATKISTLISTCTKFAVLYHPATNGAVERANSTLVLILRKIAISNPFHWPRFLDNALLTYLISYHWVIGLSSFKALYCREPTIPYSILSTVNSLGPGSAETGMRLIDNKLTHTSSCLGLSESVTTSELLAQNGTLPKQASYAL